jgi:hypothetical protein
MKTRIALLTLAAGAAIVTTLAVAGPEHGHPNIIAARKETQNAIEHMRKAQHANEFDMGGHAQKAIDLLNQAQEEMRAAAETDNKKN